MRTFLFFLLISALPSWARAEIAYLEMRPNISASAEYLPGQSDKPAILLLHGFLQTRDFSTVTNLARSLRDAGYPVLVPTLSLGIPNRQRSLPCEAIHRHSLNDDTLEISRWVHWLKSRGHRSTVLIGHSFGSLQLLAYLNGSVDKTVKAYIGASLIEAKIDSTNRSILIARLNNQLATDQIALVTQELSLCKKYTSTPEGLLSYIQWDQTQILSALKNTSVKTLLIMGAADNILERNWLKALAHIQTPMVIVAGANHFMDGEHEFDLLDKTLTFLKTVQKDRAP